MTAKARVAHHADGASMPGLDLGRLRDWMDATGLGSGAITDTRLLTGGTQNILLRYRRGDREYLLRRPPLHKCDNSDETMRREARVLAALAGGDVPHPGLIASCEDVEVIGACFYLMEPVEGYNPTVTPPPPDRGVQHAMGLAMAEGIAALGRVDITGLSDFGRIDGWLERQTARWGKQLRSYLDLPGYGAEDLPKVGDVAAWLDDCRPRAWTPGLIHGDFHFANVLFSYHAPELAAIVDWELCTLGDPLLDLGHLLATWPGEGPGALTELPEAPGLPSRSEMIEHYTQASGRTVDAITWYMVMACYRLAVLLEGSHARARAGQTPYEVGETCRRGAAALLHQARDLIAHRVEG